LNRPLVKGSVSFALLAAALASTTGCAVSARSIHTFRLVPSGSDQILVPPSGPPGVHVSLVPSGASQILIPPGVGRPDVAQRKISFAVSAPNQNCNTSVEGIPVRTRHRRISITIGAAMLANKRPGWLTAWAANLESLGCLPRGQASRLAEEIAVALPLQENETFQLLYSQWNVWLDLIPQMRLEVVSPMTNHGYERAFYQVEPKDNRGGLGIVPLYAEVHQGDRLERRAAPGINYFPFPPTAGFYRIYYEAEPTDFAALIIAGRTLTDLERRTQVLETGVASCEALHNDLCVQVPKQVAINGFVPVTVNGKPAFVHWGTTIGGILEEAGNADLTSILHQLVVFRPYQGKLVRVAFDPGNSAIANLIVTGGEAISWK
jgi:hypothetical protein